MKIFVKVANNQAGKKYIALCVERCGIEKVISFDIQVILLVTGLDIVSLYGLEMGKHNIKI